MENAERAEGIGEVREINLDMKNLLDYLKSYNWDCDVFVVYHPDEQVSKNFLRFIGTFFPQLKDKKELYQTDRDQFFGLSANLCREVLNYGHIDYYRRNPKDDSSKLIRIMWVNLLSVEGYSKKLFKDISFWQAYGKLVREYGKNHF